jgi:hypothetical protein
MSNGGTPTRGEAADGEGGGLQDVARLRRLAQRYRIRGDGTVRPVAVGDGGGLERAAKPPGLWAVMWERVDRVFADLVGGGCPVVCGEGAGPEDAA